MKQKFTNWIKSAAKLGALAVIGLLSSNLSAQAPWCHNAGANPCGWGQPTGATNANYRGITEAVLVEQGSNVVFSKAADGCPGGNGGYSLINSTANAFDLTPGGVYSVTITVLSGAFTYTHRAGIWIDLNKDNMFQASECMNPTTVANIGTGNVTRTFTFTVPCTGVTAGASRMRIKSSINPMNTSSACNYLQPHETEDYSINFALPTSLSANFVVPTTIYTNNNVTFKNTSQSGIFKNDWDKDADGTYNASIQDYTTSWSVGSTTNKCLKLRAENCNGQDSITQCFDVVVPTVVPSVDFISSATKIPLFGNIKLSDLSDFGPTSWQWEVYDSTDVNNVKSNLTGAYFNQNGTSLTSKNPELLFIESGKYTVCLTATNGVGASKRVCKTLYVEVLPLQDFTIGSGGQVTTESNGRIYDHAGPDVNYANNRSPNTDKFLINPCGATQIDFEFSQLKFGSAGDSLFIYAGENAAAPRIAAIGRNTPVPYKTTVMGGAAYITFQSNGSGVDSGFIGTFKSVLGPQVPPVVDFDLPTDGYFGVEVDLNDKSTNKLGIPTYQWDIYEPFPGAITASYFTEKAKHTFLTTGKVQVCLTVDGCAGSSTKCKEMNINVPTTPTELDYVADNRRPSISDQVQMTTTSDKANKFLWSAFPVTATFSDPTAKNPTVDFSAPGPYTFTLRAWNTADSAATVKTLVKDKYVVVVDYCTPVVNILSSDVAISSFKVSHSSGNGGLYNTSSVGVDGYNDFSGTYFVEGTFGATYDFEIERPSTVDSANTKVWVDFNLDGTFAPSEMVKSFPISTAKTLTGSFTVPNISQSFIGTGKIRVSMAYGNTANTPCGPVLAGEVEDYGIKLDNDMMPPVITLIGSADTTVERVPLPGVPNYVDPGATAWDATEGDITSKITVTTDMDQNTAGIYTYTYCITDASGNGPICVTRTIKVVLDRTAPTLTLNGNNPDEVCFGTAFADAGATAADAVDGNLTPSITVTGTVDETTTGSYVLTYSVSDVQGNTSTATRTVVIKDCNPPVITAIGSEKIQINTIWADQTVVNDDYDGKNGKPATVLVATPGPNGMPNTTVRASYPVTYTATDAYGNAAVPVLRNYVVDDFVAPVIDLKTLDTVWHRVNTPYFSTDPLVEDNFYDKNNVSLAHIDKGNVDEYTLGTYTETFVAVDGSGNTDTAIRYIKVIDDVKPVIFAPTINGCAGYGIDNMADVQISDNYDAPSSLIPNIRFINNNVNVHVPGIYSMTYQVTDLSGNVSDPFTRQVSISYCLPGSTNVKTVDLAKATTVYPSPSAGNISVKVAGVSNQEVVVTVYNAVGASVATANSSNGEVINLDLTSQASGIYTVNVTTGGQTITKKVVLTK